MKPMTDTPDIHTMIDLLKQLVQLESPSHEKEAVDKLGKFLQEKCRAMGGEIILHPQVRTGNHFEARFFQNQNTGGNKNNILVLCHMDTVFPLGTLSKFPFRQEGDKLFGPAVADMKGGIVVTLAALSSVIQSKSVTCTVTVLFTADEEIGSTTSRALIEKLAQESCLVLVLEPGMADGAVKTWRKGVGEFTVVVKGRAAHAGGDHHPEGMPSKKSPGRFWLSRG